MWSKHWIFAFRFICLAAVLALNAACAAGISSNPRISLRYEKAMQAIDVEQAIARSAGRDVAVTELGRTAWVSHHVAVIRTGEQPHYHRFHDMTVFTVRGGGTLVIEQKEMPMNAGDVVHIGRGIPHYFRNTGSNPAVALVVFSPPFDGRDTVTAPEEVGQMPKPLQKNKNWWPF